MVFSCGRQSAISCVQRGAVGQQVGGQRPRREVRRGNNDTKTGDETRSLRYHSHRQHRTICSQQAESVAARATVVEDSRHSHSYELLSLTFASPLIKEEVSADLLHLYLH